MPDTSRPRPHGRFRPCSSCVQPQRSSASPAATASRQTCSRASPTRPLKVVRATSWRGVKMWQKWSFQMPAVRTNADYRTSPHRAPTLASPVLLPPPAPAWAEVDASACSFGQIAIRVGHSSFLPSPRALMCSLHGRYCRTPGNGSGRLVPIWRAWAAYPIRSSP